MIEKGNKENMKGWFLAMLYLQESTRRMRGSFAILNVNS
ncbi:hypothetical protein PPHE_b0276 [Pseudoalteromonas phenolica O-BC30]|nr:hypothetical protein [Pseudoalteromonas phenolica O-BC30]